jgi:glycosyltransferase involved in cell wall biosynthesis
MKNITQAKPRWAVARRGSRDEYQFPIALQEALGSDATAGPNLFMAWESGFIFPASDWSRLASQLDYWLRNVDRRRRSRDAVRKRAESFSWDRFRGDVREACGSALAE